MDNKEFAPKELMEYIKLAQVKSTNEELSNFYNICLEKLDKYIKTGQIDACKKVEYLAKNVEKEFKLLEHGINTYIYFNDIKEYINNVKDKQISIIELENYEREIPDEIANTVIMCKENNLFDKYIVIFTDYNKEMSKKVSKKDREKDPILLGMFYDDKSETACPRFYYLGDWEDEYCDLTLEKFLTTVGQDKEYTINRPAKTLNELTEDLSKLVKSKNSNFTTNIDIGTTKIKVSPEEWKQSESKSKNIFKRIKSIFKKGE